MRKYIVLAVVVLGLAGLAWAQSTNSVPGEAAVVLTTNKVNLVMTETTEAELRKEFRVWKKATGNTNANFSGFLEGYLASLVSWHGMQAPQRISAMVDAMVKATNATPDKIDRALDDLR
jgi:hypothetical protein